MYFKVMHVVHVIVLEIRIGHAVFQCSLFNKNFPQIASCSLLRKRLRDVVPPCPKPIGEDLTQSVKNHL